MNIFDVVLIAPIVNLLMFFYKIFSLVGLPGTLGFAIIAVTAFTRLAINPFMKKQIEQSSKMQKLQPQIAKLQKKYKKEPMKLQQAQMALYKEHKINPGGGCLIFLIQMPLFIGLYNALIRVSNSGELANLKNINNLLYSPFLKTEGLNLSFLHLNLTKTPAEWQTLGWWYLIIPVVTAGLQFLQAHLSGKVMQPAKEPKPKKEIVKAKKTDQKTDPLAMQQMMQKQMLFLFPLMIGWVSFSFPVGLALYWNVFNLFGIWQYYQQFKQKALVE